MNAALIAATVQNDERSLNVRAAVEDTKEISLIGLTLICRTWREYPEDLWKMLHGAYIVCSGNLFDSPVWEEIKFLDSFYRGYTT